MVVCDKWVAVKVIEVIFCVSCIIAKRVTDDESVRLTLYLQKISREWSLLRNITWSSIGASFGDAVYGGYVIITFGLLLAKIFEEVPKGRRILEKFLLGLGALFFIILGGLELASLDSIPDSLIDNAAVLGVLSLVTAALFLIDLAGPREKVAENRPQALSAVNIKTLVYPKLSQESQPEKVIEKNEPKATIVSEKNGKVTKKDMNKKVDKKSEEIEQKDEDEVNTFVTPQNDGYQKYNDNTSLETIEKTKFGSMRNGNPKHLDLFDKMPINHNKFKQDVREFESKYGHLKKPAAYEEEMDKNAAYLKMLEDKRMQKQFIEPANTNERFVLKNSIPLDRQSYPYLVSSRSFDYDRNGKRWDAFEEESLPPFPVKEDYLPVMQTPVFSKIKQNGNHKNHGIYDNYSHYKSEGSQTDSLRSKMSTLKSKPPTLQQIAEYFGLEKKKNERKEAASQVYREELPAVSFVLPTSKIKMDCGGEPISPTDPGYVQYTAQRWDEKHDHRQSTRTPRHSPTDD